MVSSIRGSMPYERSPWRASPLSLRTMRLYGGSGTSATSASQLEAGEPPDTDVLARLAHHLRDQVLHRLRLVTDERLGKKGQLVGVALGAVRDLLSGKVARVSGRDLQGYRLSEFAEVLRAGDEIRLAVYLDQRAEAAVVVNVRLHDAFRLLGGHGEALRAQDLLRLIEIAPGLFERVLAVEHAGAGQLAQFFHGSSRDGHIRWLLD